MGRNVIPQYQQTNKGKAILRNCY